MSAPFPYVACLMADGDHMGKTLDGMTHGDDHRAVSKRLATFVQKARGIVEHAHRGLLIYGGGDDLLAFVCLTDALACARQLHDAFADEVALPLRDEGLIPAEALPSLSVGLGVGHLLTPMGELRALGDQALELAKGRELPVAVRRNALAILLDKRSGGQSAWRGRWELDPVTCLEEDARLLGDRLSHKKVFEIQRLLQRLPVPTQAGAAWGDILILEVTRSLSRVRGDEGITPEEVGLTWEQGQDYAQRHQRVSDWINRMLVARAFADARVREQRS